MTQTGAVYGGSLYELARDEQLSEQIMQELKVLRESFRSEPDFIRLLACPTISKQERCQILEDSFRGKVHPYLLNFLKILTEKGYMRHFDDCCLAYTRQYHQDCGILSVTAVTAVPLKDAQSEKLREKLSRITGKQIELVNKVDPKCLGGIRLDYDGQRLDDTVQHRLDSIRDLLNNTVL